MSDPAPALPTAALTLRPLPAASTEPVTGPGPRDEEDTADGGTSFLVAREVEASAPPAGGLPSGITSQLAASRATSPP